MILLITGSGILYFLMHPLTTAMALSNEILCPIDTMIGFLLSEVLLRAAPQTFPEFPTKSI
jgi:hypothetical protein